MYITRVYLKNLKCFHEIELRFDPSGDSLPWTVILGDNATGKTALLRAIALGLCDESSAASLMKESEEGYIRRGARGDAKIVIELRRGGGGRAKYTIETTIERVKTRRGSVERLRQTTPRKRSFPRQEIFACAYGAGRGTAGTGDISGYTLLNAVYNLFNYGEGLQNPELTIRRLRSARAQDRVKKLLAELTRVDRVTMSNSGLTVDGDWGRNMPLRDLADGYKSTMLWLTDFLGWAIAYDSGFSSPSLVRGIVIIDELDQHLHPRWQETIVEDLRQRFPLVQFITSTHSPLIASSLGAIDPVDGKRSNDKVCYLELTRRRGVTSTEIPTFRGMRVDQVLASRAFDYLVTTDSEVNQALRLASRLAGKRRRSSAEESQYERLKALIARSLILQAESPVERALEREFLAFMKKKTARLESTLFGERDD